MLNILKVRLLVLPRAQRKEEPVDVLEKHARHLGLSLQAFCIKELKQRFMKLMHDS